jgi:hypothetical protein
MRSHRLAPTLLVLAALATTAAGCGSGRDTEAFLPDDPPATAQAPSAPAPPAAPVVIAGPQEDVVRERDAASAEAARQRAAAEREETRRRAARKEAREERATARRARRRALAREEVLRDALRDARRRRASAPIVTSLQPATRPQASAPITASDVGGSLAAERNRRSTAEARAAVLRFHDLLDAHDARACDLLTPRLLAATYGAAAGAADRCREAVARTTWDVSATLGESAAQGRYASVAVVSRVDGTEVPQTLRLLLVNGTWMLDAVERKPAS